MPKKIEIHNKNESKMKDNEFKCTCCGKIKPLEKDFYKSFSVLYQATGRLAICKGCIDGHYNDLLTRFESSNKAIYEICRKLDACYSATYYKSAVQQVSKSEKNESICSVYFTKINSLGIKNGLGKDFGESDIYDGMEEVIQEIPYEVIKMFGTGYTKSEYREMQEFYTELLNTYDSSKPLQRELYKQICTIPVQMRRALSSKDTDAYNKLSKTFSAMMGDLNIKPSKELGSEDGGVNTWGEWVKKVEETEPIPEASEEFKDVDKISKYIDKWFVKHFAKILGLLSDNEDKEQEVLEMSESELPLDKEGDSFDK